MCEKTEARYLVPQANIDELVAGIERLNKRAAKLGCPQISYNAEVDHVRVKYEAAEGPIWAGPEEVARYDQRIAKFGERAGIRKTSEVMPWLAVSIIGNAPKFDGWRFVATLEPVEVEGGESVCLILSVPGESCPSEMVNRNGECDHCHSHRQRKQTFVVAHDDGRYCVVGRQCLKDFLGHNSPHNLASWAEILAQLNEMAENAEHEFWGSGSYKRSFSLESVLQTTLGVIREHGWVSRAAAGDFGRSTSSGVSIILNPPMMGDNSYRSQLIANCAPGEAEFKEAEAILEWINEMDFDAVVASGNNYMLNLRVLARAGFVNNKTLGLACSMVSAYRKHIGQEAERKLKASFPVAHIGVVGKRSVFRVYVEKMIPTESDWGQGWIVIMTGITEGVRHPMVWFASGSNDLSEREEFEIKATVKKHGERDGKPQTIVNRVAVVKCLSNEEILKPRNVEHVEAEPMVRNW